MPHIKKPFIFTQKSVEEISAFTPQTSLINHDVRRGATGATKAPVSESSLCWTELLLKVFT